MMRLSNIRKVADNRLIESGLIAPDMLRRQNTEGDFQAPQDKIWLDLSSPGSSRFIAGMQDDPWIRSTGYIYIRIFAPLDDGLNDVENLAENILQLFEGFEYEHLAFNTGDYNHLGRQTEWHVTMVSIPYRLG